MKREELSDIELLKQVTIFHGLEVTQLGEIAAHASRRVYEKGQQVSRSGACDDAIFAIVPGSARAYRSSGAGWEIIMEVLGTSDAFPLSRLSLAAEFESNLEAREAGTMMYRISRPYLVQLLRSQSGVAIRVVDALGRSSAAMATRVKHPLGLVQSCTNPARSGHSDGETGPHENRDLRRVSGGGCFASQ